MISSVGKFTVTTPGTLVRLTSGQTTPAAKYSCHAIMVQALPANVGKVYIGTSAMSRAALTGLYAILPLPSTTSIPVFTAALTLAPNSLNLADLFIDADNANDGVIVTLLIN